MNDKSTMNKIMEYRALGKSIVQFDLTEGRPAQGASLYAKTTDPADFGDWIHELLDDPARSVAMGEAGRACVRDVLAWEQGAPKLLTAYENLFEASPIALSGRERKTPVPAPTDVPAE
jgi:glycosyltransferase involved in cell wall biosynthesis